MKRNHLFTVFSVMILFLVFTACNDDEPTEAGTEVGELASAPTATPVVEATAASMGEATATPDAASGSGETSTSDTTDASGGNGAETGGELPQTEDGETTEVAVSVPATHTVMEREWMHQIARCYGTSPNEVIQANNLTHPGWIMPGEVWTIPNPGSMGEVLGAPCIIYYSVQQGDTLYSISRAYSVPVDVLTFVNYGCYGYNAHYDYGYYPPIPTPYGDGGHYYYDYYQGYGYLGGCRYYSYPWLYIGELLVIPVNAENMHLR